MDDAAAVRDEWCAEYVKARDENRRLRQALLVIAEGTLVPDLFPKLDVDDDAWEMRARTAQVTAIAALVKSR